MQLGRNQGHTVLAFCLFNTSNRMLILVIFLESQRSRRTVSIQDRWHLCAQILDNNVYLRVIQ
jgi:hypothetical protein